MEHVEQSTREEGLLWPAARGAGIVALTAVVAAAARALLHVQDVEMIFLLGVMATALVAGRRAALVAAALSVAVFDWFFVPPFYTLDVADPRHVTTFAVMFVASLVIGTLVLRLREQREEALARAGRTAALHAASRELSGALDVAAVARATCRGAAQALGAEAAWFEVGASGAVTAVASEPPGAAVGLGAVELAKEISDRVGWEFAPTLFFAHPTLQSVADRLAALDGARWILLERFSDDPQLLDALRQYVLAHAHLQGDGVLGVFQVGSNLQAQGTILHQIHFHAQVVARLFIVAKIQAGAFTGFQYVNRDLASILGSLKLRGVGRHVALHQGDRTLHVVGQILFLAIGNLSPQTALLRWLRRAVHLHFLQAAVGAAIAALLFA